MSTVSFVTPTTDRIELSEGRWIMVKSELDVADQRRMDALALVPVRLSDGTVHDRVDWGVYEILRTHLWITEWGGYRGPDGKERPYSLDAIKALFPEVFNEMNNAVYDHIMRGIEAKKKKRSTPSPSPDPEPATPDVVTST